MGGRNVLRHPLNPYIIFVLFKLILLVSRINKALHGNKYQLGGHFLWIAPWTFPIIDILLASLSCVYGEKVSLVRTFSPRG